MRMVVVSVGIAAGLALGSPSDAARTATTGPSGIGDTAPVWSADGRRIAFERWVRTGRRVTLTVMVVGAREGPPRTLGEPGDALWAAISPDLSAVAVQRPGLDGALEVFRLPVGPWWRVAPAAGPDLAWSPDGSQLAFTAQSLVHTVAAGGGGSTAIGPGSNPDWSPDGARIAYVAYTRSPTQAIVTVARPDGTGPRHELGQGSLPSWAPDGARIAYLASEGLVVTDATGDARRLYAHPSLTAFSAPQWSPDGTRIAATAEDGRVLVIELATGRKRYWTRGHARTLSWSPAGDQLAVGLSDPECRRPGIGVIPGGGAVRKLTLECRIRGTKRDDTLRGTDLRDLIFGRAGDDRLVGRAGDDRFEGGPGRDTIRCGPGVDSVYADRLDRVAADCERVARR